MLVHFVAKEECININKLNISIYGDLDPAKFVGQLGFTRARIQTINVNIAIDADADDAAINKIITIAKGRCPINDNLSNVTQINYDVKKASII